MNFPKFSMILSLSDKEITEEIIQAENKLFNLRFKKATRQNLKSHEIKYTKRYLAHLKTLLTSRLKTIESVNEINK
nr:ribosomal protein L29 [Pseudo-nitzschia hainanensis]